MGGAYDRVVTQQIVPSTAAVGVDGFGAVEAAIAGTETGAYRFVVVVAVGWVVVAESVVGVAVVEAVEGAIVSAGAQAYRFVVVAVEWVVVAVSAVRSAARTNC